MKDRRRAHRWLAIAAAALGALALAAGDPYPGGASRASGIGVLAVARWLRDGNASVRLLDIRADSQVAAYHIPGAEHVTLDELRHRKWRRDETAVVYADDDRRAEEATRLLRTLGVEHAHVLRGGLRVWIDSIVEPRVAALPLTARPDDRRARREHLELSRYFGGMPVVSPSPLRETPGPAAPIPSRRSEATAVARMLRRGC